MDFTITEAARALEVKENVVRGYIAAGKLPFDIRDGQVVIPQSAVDAMLKPERKQDPGGSPPSTPQKVRFPQEEALRSVLRELFSIQEQLELKWELSSANLRLLQELRDKDRMLAQRSAEIDRLKRELAHHKAMAERELGEREKLLEERLRVSEEQLSERLRHQEELSRERSRLVEEEWTRRLAEEQERAARAVAEARKHDGLWTRLVKMLTWS